MNFARAYLLPGIAVQVGKMAHGPLFTIKLQFFLDF